MTAFVDDTQEKQQMLQDMLEDTIRQVFRADILPELKTFITEAVTQTAREACRCALTDELDYVAEKGNELFKQATKAGRPPSTFRE